MKKINSMITLMLICSAFLLAQNQQITVRAGADLVEALSHRRYLFPQFQSARVFLVRESLDADMNYNALTDKMEFIDENGDTFVLKDNVVAIVFGSRMFKHTTKGYMEIIADSFGAELLVHRKFKATGSKKTSAYGMVDETGALSTIASIDINSGKPLSLDEEITYSITNTYYINDGGKYRLANRAGFTKAFGKRLDMDRYLRETPVNFLKIEDLTRFFAYCTQE